LILIVGGNARGVGKTTLVCHLIAALPERQWVAVKISGHPHGASSTLPVVPASPRATDLFAQAGAAETHLLRDTPDHRTQLGELAASGRHLIIESNRAVEWVRFDQYLFVLDEHAANPKPRERWHLARATWVLPPRQPPPEALLRGVTNLR
jgi:hypothetical protein